MPRKPKEAQKLRCSVYLSMIWKRPCIMKQQCAVLSFLTVKIKAHCKGTAKILNVSALKRTNTRLGRVNRIKKSHCVKIKIWA